MYPPLSHYMCRGHVTPSLLIDEYMGTLVMSHTYSRAVLRPLLLPIACRDRWVKQVSIIIGDRVHHSTCIPVVMHITHLYHIYTCIMHISSYMPPQSAQILFVWISSGQVSAFGVIYALYKAICMVILSLYHCYTTVCAHCILYQVYQWYSRRIWHISQWKVCYMPQSVLSRHISWWYTSVYFRYHMLY